MGTDCPSLLGMYKIRKASPLWFDDGNLILTTASTAFKVHRSILERHSLVLKNIFEFPNREIGPELDSAPIIHMEDDPKDLEYFLLALYDGLYFEQRRAANFSAVNGALRLSIKYMVEYLRLECLKLLHHDWPTSLAAWDRREQESTGPNGAYESAWTRPHPILVIHLAQELGAEGVKLLPAAFYDLSRYNCSHIWTGCPSTPPTSTESPIGVTSITRLSAEDLQTVMIGKERSQTFIAQFLLREFKEKDIAAHCEHGSYDDWSVCSSAFDELAHELYRGIVGVTCGRDSDPLYMLDAAMTLQQREKDGVFGLHPASRACEQCRNAFAQIALSTRRHIWDQLPSWFGLEKRPMATMRG